MAHVPLREPECIKVIKYFWRVLNDLFIKIRFHTHIAYISQALFAIEKGNWKKKIM